MYSQGVENENYLRGVQAAGADGIVEFTSVFPACYSGRWPHIHFEVYPSLDTATDAAQQDRDVADRAARGHLRRRSTRPTGYEPSVQTFSRVSLASDMVFADDGGVARARHDLRLRRGRPHRGARRGRERLGPTGRRSSGFREWRRPAMMGIAGFASPTRR